MTTLDAALSGLRVAQQSLDVISTNISNASTPGYTRKVLPQTALMVNGTAVGAQAEALTRAVDTALIASLNHQTSVSSGYDIRQIYLQRIQDFNGPSDQGQSLSAKVTTLANSFTQLSLSPDDLSLQKATVTAAQQVASSLNNYSSLINDMRINAETDVQSAVSIVNQALDNIANLNQQIQSISTTGQNTADLKDQRDLAIQTVAKYMSISTYTADSQIVVMTGLGQTLADGQAHHLFFQQANISPTTYYPGGGLNGLYLGGSGPPTGIDITQANLGGQLGALFTLRDTTLPQYSAQIDEFAQKLADRFNGEGLKLFTDLSGNVPANVAPPGLVGYVGFASLIKVNQAVVGNPNLLVDGTTGNTELPGSNEVIRRIAQFTFGTVQSQTDTSAVDITFGGAMTPLITGLGLTTMNRVTGNTNIATYADFSTLPPGGVLPASFDLTLGGTTKTITVLPTDNANNVVNNINAAFGGTYASINGNGQLAINYQGQIQIADNTIGAATMASLGFNFGVYPPPNPSFQVQVGTRTPVTITITPADTAATLLTQLNAVTGLTASLDAGGHLVMTPTDGGDLTLTDGPGSPLAAMTITNTNNLWTPMRQFNLGPDGSVSTGLLANSTLQDYAASLITAQSEDYSLNQNQQKLETSFLQTLQARNSNASGVNIDQEMSSLIRIQSAYAAAAKMIAADQKLMDELMNTF